MKLFAVFLLAVAAVSPEVRYFAWERPILNMPQRPIQTCLVVDSELFAHSSAQLADLRLYHGGIETPYVLHLSAPVEARETSIVPINLGRRGGDISFDAAMPEGSYSDLRLDVAAQDFLATVTVFGSHERTGSSRTGLGSYTIFDLSRQKLGRSTVLHIPTSDFRYLHFQVAGPLTPESITGLALDKLLASEARYESVAQSSSITQKDHASVLEFTVPARVPVDRVAFTFGPEPSNFSRNVTISVTAVRPPAVTDGGESAQPVIVTGNVLRIHSVQNRHRIDEENLVIDTPGAALDRPAKWTVTIDNGSDAPLPVQSARLQMFERTLCFEAAGSGQYRLLYGDPPLSAARYDYATLFTPQLDAARATLGPEQQNREYRQRPDERPVSERYPALLWGALVLVIATLAAIALRSGKRWSNDAG